jgi:prepilin-type N-terminal cleavage/methylation domain-containing protein
MHSLTVFRKSTASAMRAFTLIELLVVIAIIAILAGLLFPAAQSALNSAKKTTAKNQIVQIATAITAYETEYGCLPSNSGAIYPGPIDSTLVGQLTTNNPRSISFLDVSSWKLGKGGTNSSGSFCDPFSNTNVYSVALDTNYANFQSNVALGGGFGSTNLPKHIMVWSTPLVGRTNVLINSWD